MSETILIADDDGDNRRIMELTLARAGYKVVLAEDGERAVAAAVRERPDLIVLDLSMPVLSGWDAAARLKGDPRFDGVPILAFTAHAMSGDEARVRAAGFDGYLTKPCAPRRAVEAVAAALRLRAVRRES